MLHQRTAQGAGTQRRSNGSPHCPPHARTAPVVRSNRRACAPELAPAASLACASLPARAAEVASTQGEKEVWPGVQEAFYEWRGHKIRYQRSSSANSGPAVVLVHGFGGNADHWRKSTGALAAEHGMRAFSIDLLGYGFSSKPDPRLAPRNSIYCFENWGQQLVDFIQEVVGGPCHIVCNSVGGLAGLQASLISPELVRGVQLYNISLRGLHVERQPSWQRPFVAAFQQLLRETQLGVAFFGSVAKEQTVRNILRQAYGRKDAVTDELVRCILTPGLQDGAVYVFLDFISYSGGPLPEDLISRTTRPVSIVWGEVDPWEDMTMAKQYFAHLPSVKEFVTLPGVGHCPQDEAPELVNPLIHKFCTTHT